MTATAPSGLQITTTYYFKVNTVEYNILTGDPAPTFQEVADLMDTALSSAEFSTVISGDVPDQDIRVINEGDRGWDSEIDLSYGTSGPNLWTNLTGFVEFDEAVPGRGAFSIDLGYVAEIGGKAQTSGAATYFHVDEPPIGSIIISGTSLPIVIDILGTQAFGSLLTGGTSYYQIGYVWIPGGVQDDVEVSTFGDVVYGDSVYMSANPESGIKIEISGAAEYEMEIIATVEDGGKVTIGGVAITEIDIVIIPDGGIIIEGSVVVDEFILSYNGSGSASFAGAGDTEHSNKFEYETSGGAVFGGSGIVAIEYTYNGLYFGDNYYPLNERTGTTANDVFAGGNDLTLSASDLIERGNCESTTPPMIFDETVPVLYNSTWVRDLAQAYQGIYSYKFTKTIIAGTSAYASLVDSQINSDLHGMLPGHTYKCSMRVYIPSASGILASEIRLAFQWYDGTWSVIGVSPSIYDSWQLVELEVTLGPKATGALWNIGALNTTGINEYFYVDNIILNLSMWTDDAVFISAVQFDKGDWSTLGTDIDPQAVSFWHKRKTVDQDSYRVFGASADDEHWYFAYEPSYFRAMIRNGASYYYFFNGTDYILIPDDDQYHWYYIEFYSGSNAAIYIDNVYRGTTSNFFSTNTYKLHTIGNGGDAAGPGIYGFGPIDDLRIYSSYRLDVSQRNSIYTQSPDPGSIVLGGAAQIQPVILVGGEYVYVPTGSITLIGDRYSYVVKSTAITAGGTSPTDIEFSYIGSGGIILQSISTYHDFGLGYIYEVSGGIKLTSKNLLVIIIETSYYILIQEVGEILTKGTADTEYYPQYEYVASGEALHLGNAEYSIVYEYAVSGGATFAGTVPADEINVIETTSGGATFAGTVPADEINVIETTSGGTTFAGEGVTYNPPYGFYGGGADSGNLDTIDYINMNLTTCNAVDRGNLTVARGQLAGVSGSQYGFYGGGWGVAYSNVIDYIDINLLTGNAIDSGDLAVTRARLAGVSGSQYGFYGGGYDGSDFNVIDYIDVTTATGGATDNGDLTLARHYLAGVSGPQYGFYGGGYNDGISNIIDYIDVTTATGNAIDSGDLTVARWALAGISGPQYGFYGGGNPSTNVIDYIDVTTATGGATDSGDLTVARHYLAGVSGPQYGFYGGGLSSNIIDYIDVTTATGGATDSGDLTVARHESAGVS